MRHITDPMLDRIEPLLEQLRAIDGLVETQAAACSTGGRSAFLHFHDDGDDIYADVRLDGDDFERMRVTTKAEQRALVAAVRRAIRRRAR